MTTFTTRHHPAAVGRVRSRSTKSALYKPTYAFIVAIFLGSIITPLVAQAQTFISQSYSSADPLALNSIASLKNDTTDEIVAATSSNSDNTLGVVVIAENSSLSLSNGGPNQVQIATSGILDVLVSDVNGPIIQGDYITASPISGVGMKATGNTRVVGVAQSNLGSTTQSQQEYTDANGEKKSVNVGKIPVLVNVSYYYKQPDKTVIPSAVQNVANALAGKTVNPVPIIVGAGIFLVTLMVVVSIIYSMIRSSIISVGRNPMSQSAVYRNVIQLSSLVLGILAVGFIAIYLVLARL
jgi:hypothetical protein